MAGQSFCFAQPSDCNSGETPLNIYSRVLQSQSIAPRGKPARLCESRSRFEAASISRRSPIGKVERVAKMISGFSQIPAGLLARSPEAIAESLASKETFPDGPGVGMRMLTFYISYGGKHLSASRRRNLERARKLLAVRMERTLKEERRQAA
jgi:tRNA(adenine34) deaminase